MRERFTNTDCFTCKLATDWADMRDLHDPASASVLFVSLTLCMLLLHSVKRCSPDWVACETAPSTITSANGACQPCS